MTAEIIEILKKYSSNNPPHDDYGEVASHYHPSISDENFDCLAADINKLLNRKIGERMPTEVRFLSPLKEEREWQEYCLHQLYSEYPNICKWQVLNGLIYYAAEANKTYIPSYDEFRSRMEEKK
jgi:hypothetical protein